jgi:Rieske 2Fe-2S family protein
MNQHANIRHHAEINQPLLSLFQRMLDEMESKESVEWDADTGTLDPKIYFDQEIYEKEIARIFKRVPLCLGHEDQLREPGSMIARDLYGVPLLLVRDRKGQIHGLVNVCRHRGARLVAGEEEVCRKGALSCPYHAWTYDLDGTLRTVPGAEAFPDLDKSQRGLRRIPVQVRHGLIWGIFDANATDIDVASFLGGIDDDLAAMELGPHRFYRQHARRRKCNWKLVMDAFQEFYHIKRLHARTIGPFFLDTKSAGEGVGPHMRVLVGREGLTEAKLKAPGDWDMRRDATLTHVIFPNTVIVYHPDYTSHLGMFPTAADEILFVHTMFTPHEAQNEKEKAHWDRSFALLDGGVFGEEDLFISEQIQLGLKSGANDSFLLGRFEHHLRRFHGHIERMLKD